MNYSFSANLFPKQALYNLVVLQTKHLFYFGDMVSGLFYGYMTFSLYTVAAAITGARSSVTTWTLPSGSWFILFPRVELDFL